MTYVLNNIYTPICEAVFSLVIFEPFSFFLISCKYPHRRCDSEMTMFMGENNN